MAAEPTVVRLDERLSIAWDGRNWCLQERVTRTARETKEEYQDEQTIGYYADLGAAARRVLRDRLSEQGEQNIVQMVRSIQDALEGVTASISRASGWPVAPVMVATS
jgi:hypothetical protein